MHSAESGGLYRETDLNNKDQQIYCSIFAVVINLVLSPSLESLDTPFPLMLETFPSVVKSLQEVLNLG